MKNTVSVEVEAGVRGQLMAVTKAKERMLRGGVQCVKNPYGQVGRE